MTNQSASTLYWGFKLSILIFLFSARAHAQKSIAYYTDITLEDRVTKGTDTIVTFDPATYEETVTIAFSETHTRVDQLPRYLSPNSDCEHLSDKEREGCTQSAFAADLLKNLVLPESLKNSNIHGSVIFEAKIRNGHPMSLDGIPVKSLSPEHDKAVLMALMYVRGKWIGGTVNNRPVDTNLLIKIEF